MEIKQLLNELLSDKKKQDVPTNYFDVVASNSPFRSPLSFDGAQILSPILSESEKEEMREFRRKAVHLEQKHFEGRREKYFDLLLKVTELSDKFEASKRRQDGIPSQIHSNPSTAAGQSLRTQIVSENLQPLPSNIPQTDRDQIQNEKDITQETSLEKKNRSFEDNKVMPTAIFQKPRMHRSSTSPNREKGRPVNTSLGSNIPSRVNINESTVSTGQNSVLEKPTTSSSSLQSNIPEMSIDEQTSSLHNSTLENPMVFSSSLARNIPSELSIDESLSIMGNSTLGIDSTSLSTSTLKSSQQSCIRTVMIDGSEIDPSDSLVSTVLSMAFTDSSIASQQSVLGVADQSIKSVQRQLNMDKANHNLYHSYHQNVKPQTSTPNDVNRKHSIGKPAVKKGISSINISDSRKTYTKTDYKQDKALEKLEIMRKKLLEEKEKQMTQIRQQELARLRTSKSRPQSVTLGHYSGGATDAYSQGHVSSRPNSDMYSIPERSFDGTSSSKQSYHSELESASDKENNIYRDGRDHNNAYQIHYNNEVQVQNDNETNEFGDNLQDRYSAEIIDSRPISIHSKKYASNSYDCKSVLYVRHEFQKQFEIEMSKQVNGRDKFSVLSAYAKGFMTRHLCKSEKVQEIIKTIKDTTEFLEDISREGKSSYQREDKSLQERVQAQLVAAKTKLYDIFFTLPIKERMAYIAHSRNAAREREDRMNTKRTESKQLTRKLSAATMKAMQRRQDETNHSTTSDAKKSSPSRPSSVVGKRGNMDARALRPVHSTKSPQGAGRSQTKRRSLASPLARRSLGKKTANNRTARLSSNRKSFGLSNIETDKPIRPSRLSLDNGLLAVKRTKPNMPTKPNMANDNNTSKLPVKKPNHKSSLGSATYRVSDELCNDLGQTRPSKASTISQAPKKQQTNDRPKSAVAGLRRVTRSMAAQFKK